MTNKTNPIPPKITEKDNIENTPLWLPPGSVRAIIALALTALVFYLAVTGSLQADKVLAILGVVVGFYFGTKVQKVG